MAKPLVKTPASMDVSMVINLLGPPAVHPPGLTLPHQYLLWKLNNHCIQFMSLNTD